MDIIFNQQRCHKFSAVIYRKTVVQLTNENSCTFPSIAKFFFADMLPFVVLIFIDSNHLKFKTAKVNTAMVFFNVRIITIIIINFNGAYMFALSMNTSTNS